MRGDLSDEHPDENTRIKLARRVDLLVPIVKSVCTDLGFEVAVTGVQIFGGYGYTSEFPVEQLVRDAKIQSIYEGTNGIQAMDLVGRKIAREAGARVAAWSTALLYSAVHFLARARIPADEVATDSGLRLLAGALAHFADPLPVLDSTRLLARAALHTASTIRTDPSR